MNGSPHVHRVKIGKKDCFPLIRNRWVVVYGDQSVTLGVTSTFLQRWRNPKFWTPEKRERKVASAIAKVIAKHDRESKAANFEAELATLSRTLNRGAEHIGPYDEAAKVLTWPSESGVKQLPVVTNV